MPDGTAPVNVEDDATSDTPGNVFHIWNIVDGNAYKYFDTTSHVKAVRVANDIKGVITVSSVVADYR